MPKLWARNGEKLQRRVFYFSFTSAVDIFTTFLSVVLYIV